MARTTVIIVLLTLAMAPAVSAEPQSRGGLPFAGWFDAIWDSLDRVFSWVPTFRSKPRGHGAYLIPDGVQSTPQAHGAYLIPNGVESVPQASGAYIIPDGIMSPPAGVGSRRVPILQ